MLSPSTKRLFISLCALFVLVVQGFAQSIGSSLTLFTVNGNDVPYQINGGDVPSKTYVPYHDFQKQTGRIHQQLASGWKKQRRNLDHALSLAQRDAGTIAQLESNGGGRHTTGYNDMAWQTVNVPVNENTMPSYENLSGVETYDNGAWYRKSFTVNSSWENNKYITLNFLGAGYIIDVWLNGQYLGFHEGGYTPFVFDVTDKLDYNGTNVLAVRVDVIPWGTTLATDNVVLPFKEVDWFNHWGIYREVFLTVAEKNHVVRSDVKTLDNSGNINIKTAFYNTNTSGQTVDATLEIFEADFSGNEDIVIIDGSVLNGPPVVTSSFTYSINAGTVNARSDNLTIPNPKYWYPHGAHAHMYVLKITLRQNGNVVDEYYTEFGLRTLTTQCSKIILNGKPAPFLVGVGRHEESPWNGRAMTNAEIFHDIDVIQNDLNANLIRSHYPLNPITYKYQDRLGIVAFSELPVYWFHNWWDYDRMDNRTIREQMWREMIFASYNSPSIWFWSTQNESEEWNRLIGHNQHLRDEGERIDDTRIIIQSGVGKNVNDPSHGPLDVVGLTMYYGSFHGISGDYYGGTRWALEQYHNNNPGKPIFDTEFGMWSEPNNSNGGHQLYVFNETFAAYKLYATRSENGHLSDNGFVSGCTWWAAFNWYTSHNTLVQSMGVLHMDRSSTKPITGTLAAEFAKYSSLEPTDFEYNMELIHDVPGRVEAEDYRYVLCGAGYNDLSSGNTGNEYRNDDVDIETTSDAGGGYNTGWSEAGEWMEYTINVTANGTYDFDLRVASDGGGGALHLEVDGSPITGTINIPNTNGWQNWTTVVANGINLTAGQHVLRVFIENGGFNFNYIDINADVLPVNLLSLTGKQVGNNIELLWQTSEEVNNDFFVVEHSLDPINFQAIDTIPAADFKNDVNAYYSKHKYPEAGINYYRLQQHDKDGQFTYSYIISVVYSGAFKHNEEIFDEVKLYPNPVEEELKVDTHFDRGFKIEVLDVFGSLLHQEHIDEHGGVISFASLPSGLYFIRITLADQNHKTFKVNKH